MKAEKLNTFLLATFPSLANAKQGIGDYFFGVVELKPIAEKRWSIHNSKGQLSSFIVIKKGKRYRFEQIHKGMEG